MATATTLQSYVPAPIDVVLQRGLLSAAKRVMPFMNGTLPAPLQMQGGSMTTKWRRINNLTVTQIPAALGEVSSAQFGMGRTPITPVISDVTVAIAKYGEFMYVEEGVDLFNVNSRSVQLVDNLGEQAGHVANILSRNVMDGATTIRYGSGVASDKVVTTAMAAGDIRYAVNQLQRQSAMKQNGLGLGTQEYNTSPIRASYFGVCHVDVEDDIRDIAGFIPVEKYAGYTQINIGEFGTVNGVRWSSTEIAKISDDAGTTTATGFRGTSNILNDVYSSYIYGREAVGTVGLGMSHATGIYMGGDTIPAIQLIASPNIASVANPLQEMGTLAWKMWWAGKILNANWIVKIRTLATD